MFWRPFRAKCCPWELGLLAIARANVGINDYVEWAREFSHQLVL